LTAEEKVDAWMPLWIGSYLADTMKLTTLQHGAYLLLLIAYWRERGPLADDDEELASTVKASLKEWRALRPKLERFFTIEDGVWRHGRADQELAKAQGHKAKASAKGRAGAQARWEKDAKHSPGNASGSGPGDAPGIAPGNATSIGTGSAVGIAQALLGQCPTPSPIPTPSEYSEAKASAGPDVPAPVDKSTKPEDTAVDRRTLWATAKTLLVAADVSEASAREFVGALVSDYGLAITAKAVEAAVKARPVEPKAYLAATCKELKAKPSGGQYETAEQTSARLAADAERHAAQDPTKTAEGIAAAREAAQRVKAARVAGAPAPTPPDPVDSAA